MYTLVAQHDPDGAIDVLLAHVDDMLSAGAFERCDAFLAALDLTQLDTNLLVTALSVTKRAAAQLAERPPFVLRVHARLQEIAPDRANRLLDGLA